MLPQLEEQKEINEISTSKLNKNELNLLIWYNIELYS